MRNAEKWAPRQRRAADILVVSDGRIEHVDWALIRRWEREFQAEFCTSCRHFEAERNAAADCALHRTDIVGQCWNFERKQAA